MPPRRKTSNSEQPNFEEYTGYLEPQFGDTGDETSDYEFDWRRTFVDKLHSRHNVEPEEVEQCFANQPRLDFHSKGKQEGEDVWTALGRTNAGRYLVIFFILKLDGCILLISAYDMPDDLRKKYEHKRKG
ncbi:MAG: BrnT family toxin [Armatimonadota bacterium]|nr:BrnT family toxin [Armatimonadota bacterium]